MTTITVWLLISVGMSGYNRANSSAVLATFADHAECARVMNVLSTAYPDTGLTTAQRLVCTRATILK